MSLLRSSLRFISYSTYRSLSSNARLSPKTERPLSEAPSIQVSEIFRSVQGEGPHAGRPSVFLRLGVCNLSCAWCDTPYTWLFSESRLTQVSKRAKEAAIPVPFEKVYNKSEELQKLSIHEIFSQVDALARDSVKAIVITGGEPLLHKKPLLSLLPRFNKNGFSIEFETNGTISPEGLPLNTHLNVSPKLSNSLMPQNIRLNFPVLEQFCQFPSSIFKFVVGSPSDLEEVRFIVNKLGLDSDRVYLMPQGTVR